MISFIHRIYDWWDLENKNQPTGRRKRKRQPGWLGWGDANHGGILGEYVYITNNYPRGRKSKLWGDQTLLLALESILSIISFRIHKNTTQQTHHPWRCCGFCFARWGKAVGKWRRVCLAVILKDEQILWLAMNICNPHKTWSSLASVSEQWSKLVACDGISFVAG